MSSWGRLSSTSGADGFPWVNARYIPERYDPPALPAKDNTLGVPSERHWQEDWSTADIQTAAEDHVMMSWSNSKAVKDLPVFERSEGVYLYDQNGKRFLDWTSQDQILAEGPDSIAAIMVESIVGAGGVLVPPDGYIEGIRALCDKYGILMICDEVMVGFGRTGQFFGFQHFEGVIPDIVTSAKGLTGSFLPLSMVGVRQKIKDYFWENPVGWGATYHAHPVALACAYETVKYMLKEQIVEKVQKLEPVMMQELQTLVLKHDSVRQARNVGLFGCLDLQNPEGKFIQRLGAPLPPEVQLLRQALRDQGLLALFRPPLLHCCPPLVIQEEQLREGFSMLTKALELLDREQQRLYSLDADPSFRVQTSTATA